MGGTDEVRVGTRPPTFPCWAFLLVFSLTPGGAGGDTSVVETTGCGQQSWRHSGHRGTQRAGVSPRASGRRVISNIETTSTAAPLWHLEPAATECGSRNHRPTVLRHTHGWYSPVWNRAGDSATDSILGSLSVRFRFYLQTYGGYPHYPNARMYLP